MKELIYDFFSLSTKDIEKWSKDFFWPISTKTTQKILKDLLEIYFKNINNEKDLSIKECLITYNQNRNPYIILFNYILLKKIITKKNYKIIFSNHSKVMKYLYQQTKEFPLKIEEFKNENYKKYLLRLLKDNFKTLLFNLTNKNYIPNNSYYAVNNEGVLQQDYFKKSSHWVNIVSIERLKRNYKIEKITKELESRIKNIHKQYIQYSKQTLLIEVPKFIQDDLLKYELEYFRNIFSLLKCLSKNKFFNKIKKIFMDYPKTDIRALGLIVKRNNGKTFGFPHGSWICHALSKKPKYNEFLLFDYYFIYNNSQKILFEDNLKVNTKNCPIKFISQKSKIFESYKLLYEFKAPTKIEKIMILEHQLWCDDIRWDLPETMILYEFYFYLCSMLSSLGYKIFFKKIPKSNLHNFNFFEKIDNLEVITGDIKEKKNLALADVVIFMYGQSSTFIPLICSNKKLIYIDNGWEDWNPKVYNYLNKRCSIIKTINNRDNKIRFKKKDLINSLKILNENTHNSFYDIFLANN